MKQQETVQETQGVKKVQKASVSYALEAMKKHIETIEENNLLTKDEVEQMRELGKKAATVVITKSNSYLPMKPERVLTKSVVYLLIIKTL